MSLRRFFLWFLGFAVIVGLTFGNGVCEQAEPKKERAELYKEIELFADAITLIRSDYVDEIGARELIYGALKGMFSSLDGYSQFLDPENYKEMKVETRGQFGGLGIEIGIRDGILTVISPLAGTPADEAGLKAEDRIVKIDGELTRDITLSDAVKKLRGKPGASVSISVLRESEKRLIDFDIKRAVIKIESIKTARILTDGIAYIRLAEFQERTTKDLDKALKDLKDKGMSALILDLRNNPGGLLDTAISVSEEFIPKDSLIVITKRRKGGDKIEYRSRTDSSFTEMPLVVLVNGGSASGSEIVAGAVQDNKRGIILGTKTFGKGSVQTVIPLRDESAVRLTTAEYFTPAEKVIRSKGITPDVEVPYEEPKKAEDKEEKQKEDIFKKIEDKPKEVKDKELENLFSDNQIKAALDLLKGIKIFSALKAES